MANITACLSSNSCEWTTPDALFRQLDDEFHFNLDPCSTDANAKCERHFTIADDGLSQNWGGYRVFCNPPYGRAIGAWVEKCFNESRKANTVVVLLIPARTDTKYFHKYIYHNAAEIRFIEGRLRFGDSKQGAPFPSMIVVFRRNY